MIRVSAGLIFDENGAFLVAQRAKGKLAGRWEFPGGKIEPNETEEDAAVREIAEELGLCVVAEKIAGVFSHTYAEQEVELTLVQCSLLGVQKIASDGSHTDHAWVTYDTCENIDFAPLDLQIVEFLKQSYAK